MSNELNKLRKVIAERTKGPWDENTKGSVDHVSAFGPYHELPDRDLDDEEYEIEQTTMAERADKDARFISTMGTHADAIMAVIDATQEFLLTRHTRYDPLSLEDALTALKQALGEK